MLLTTLPRQDPGAVRHRWLMPYMLPMSTGKVRHPVPLFVLMIAHNRLVQTGLAQTLSEPADRSYNLSNGRSGRAAAGKNLHRCSRSRSNVPR